MYAKQGVETKGAEEPEIDSEQIEGTMMMNIKDAIQGIPGVFIYFLAQFTGTVRTGACWAAPDSERRIPMKVCRSMKARLLCVSVASM